MKKFLATTALVALAVASGPAFADSSDSTKITITGVAEEVCSIPSAPTITGATGSPGAETSTVTIADLANPTNAQLYDNTIMLKYENVICNYAANVGIGTTNGGLSYTGTVTDLTGDFATNINYRGSANFADAGPSFVTAGSATSANVSTTGAAVDTLLIQIDQMDADGKPLLNGTYTDTITVRVGATV